MTRRLRTVKPEFFDNEVLAECSAHARLLFIGLWTLADRRGVVENRPNRIRAQVFPYETELDIRALLKELHDRSFIQRYSENGQHVLTIPTFAKHQRPHIRETENGLPMPLPGTQKAEKVKSPIQVGASPIQVGASPIQVVPCTPTIGDGDGDGDGVISPVSDETGDVSSKANARSTYPDDFSEWWRQYPTGRGSKKVAFGQWKRLTPEDRELAAAALGDWLECDLWRDVSLVKYAERWLRDRCFDDDPPTKVIRFTGWQSGEAAEAPIVTPEQAAEQKRRADEVAARWDAEHGAGTR